MPQDNMLVAFEGLDSVFSGDVVDAQILEMIEPVSMWWPLCKIDSDVGVFL